MEIIAKVFQENMLIGETTKHKTTPQIILKNINDSNRTLAVKV